ncbi:MAG: EFR1 family ferrodoxin [Clostridium sp.]
MNTKIFYYTSTGNSLYVGERISSELGNCELISMAKALKDSQFNYDCERAVFIYPVHCFGLPIVAFDFLKNLKLNNCNKIYSIAVSGGGKGDNTFKQVEYLIQNYGKIHNFFTLKYVSNYIKAGRPATEERVIETDKKNEPLIAEIIENIKNNFPSPDLISKSKGSLSNRAWRKFFRGKNNKFTVNENCINCKICEKVCPVANITMENDKPTWSKNCTDCMGCINLCPKEAINLSKSTMKKPRYKNKHILASKLFVN